MTSTRELFARHRLRCTRQRTAIYEALRRSKSHPTAEAIFHAVKPEAQRLSLATVYNTLDALCAAGLVRKLPTTTGCCRYEADTSEHLHVRFADTSEIEDVPHELGEALLSQLPNGVLEQIERRMRLRIDSVSIQLVGRRT